MIDIHKIKGYIGYGVEVSLKYKDSDEIHTALLDTEIAGICKCYNLGMDYLIEVEVEYYKLHLRSIEDLTDGEFRILNTLGGYEIISRGVAIDYNNTQNEFILNSIKDDYKDGMLDIVVVEYLQSIHIDYQDLIGQGLAIKKELE